MNRRAIAIVPIAPQVGGIISKSFPPLGFGKPHVSAEILVAVKASRTVHVLCTQGVTNAEKDSEQRQEVSVKLQFNVSAALSVQFAYEWTIRYSS